MGLPAPVGLLYWYTTLIILAALTVLNFSLRLYRYAVRPRPSQLPTSATSSPTSSSISEIKPEDEAIVQDLPSLGVVERIGRAGKVVVEKNLLETSLRIPRFYSWDRNPAALRIPSTEIVWNLAYLLGILVLAFYGTGWDVKIWAQQAGWVATAQLPLIIALAGKNNVIAFLTGIPYEKLNFLHRAAGRVFLVSLWLHAAGNWAMTKGFSAEDWRLSRSEWGTIGIIAYTGLYASSIPWIRRRLYEFFLVAHVLLAAVGLAATILHWRATAVWLWPGIGLWAADRLARILRLVILNKLWLVVPRPNASNIPSSATLTLLTPSTLMVTFENPASTLKWKAGQHFYVVMPGMSRLPWEAHPFTAITIPEPAGSREKGELSFVVRIRDGFTRLMKERVDEERKARGLPVDEQCSMKVQAAVEGPYGLAEDLSGYDAVLIFAGGSGISFALSHLLQIIEEARVGRTRVRSVKLVWMVKSRLHLSWISSILYSHTHRIPSTLQVSLDIYVTKQYFRSTDSIAPSVTSSGHAALPTNPTTQQSSDLAKYLAQHAEDPHARHRRRSRLMSTMSWATFTHAWHRGRDNHGAHTGPGTRRDTMAVVGGASQAAPPMIQVAHSQPVSVDDPTVLARDFAKPIFKWSDSFGQEHQPPVDESEAGRSSSDEQPSSLPASPTTRRRPLPLVINEEENNMGSMHGSPTSPVISIFAPNSRRGSSVLMPAIELARDERRRSSTAAGDSSEESHAPFHDRLSNRARSPSPGAPRQSSLKRKASTDLLGLRGTRQSLSSGEDGLGDSISRRPSSILRPIPLTGQGDPTAGANGRVSPGRRVSIQIDPTHGHRKASTVGLDPKELVHPTPVHGAGLMVDFAPRTVSSYLVPPSHAMVRDGSAGSANSTLSFQSTTSPLGSGALTPNIADKEAHHPASFAQESLQRRRQSVGLEGIVHWHEGRADLHAVIEGMIRDITIARGGGGAGGEAGAGAEGAKGKGGWLSVSACGPRSLLDTAREKVREVSTVKDVWQGGVAVDFHAETFGWD